MEIDLTQEQAEVLFAFGYTRGDLQDRLTAVVDEAVAAARRELERAGEVPVHQWDPLEPRHVLALFGHEPPQSDPRAVLKALGRKVGKTQAAVESELREVIRLAEEDLARVAAEARGDGGGAPLDSVWSRSSVPASYRRVRWEGPRRGEEPGRSDIAEIPQDWEIEGPWGDSLAWLERQSRDEPLERCDRCNWPGRFRHLIGRDDGGNPLRLVSWAQPNSVGASRPFLKRYLYPAGPIDNMQAWRDHACAMCGGGGYRVALSWGADPRFRPRANQRALTEDDQRTSAEDDAWALETHHSSATAHLPIESVASHEDMGLYAVGASAATVNGAERLVLAIAHGAADFVRTGRLSLEGPEVEALKRDYAETAHRLEPLPLRQFLAEVEFGGGGELTADRKLGFFKRDGVIFGLVLAGFDVKRIALAVGLSEKQLYALRVVQTARRSFEENQQGLVLNWHEYGYSTKAVARAAGLTVRTVQRIVKRGYSSSPASLSDWSVMESLRLTFYYAPVLRELALSDTSAPNTLQIDPQEFLAGVPIDYWERRPPGMPLYDPEEPYHTYVPAADDHLGAPPDVRTMSTDVLHPFVYALLERKRG